MAALPQEGFERQRRMSAPLVVGVTDGIRGLRHAECNALHPAILNAGFEAQSIEALGNLALVVQQERPR